jgi:ferrous-iron efflux pump FieF
MSTSGARLMKAATVASTSVALVMIAAKAMAWLATDSVSMLSSLIDSSLDLVGSLITFIAVRTALSPADTEHRFGHGKAEALAGLTQAGFITASGGALLLTVGERLLRPHQVESEEIGLVISVLAVALTVGLVAFQTYVARRTNSLAIAADRAHYLTDLVSTLAAGAAIYLSGLLDQPLIDTGVAALVAFYLMYGAWNVARGSLDVLMDRELPDSERQHVIDTVRAYAEVRGIHDLRTRSSGLTKFIQLHIELAPALSFVEAHAIGDRIEADIEKVFPDAEIILHVDPLGVAERHPRDPAG